MRLPFFEWCAQKRTTEPRKNPSYFPLYWLFKRDPYNVFFTIPKQLGSIIPCIPKQQRIFFIAQLLE